MVIGGLLRTTLCERSNPIAKSTGAKRIDEEPQTLVLNVSSLLFSPDSWKRGAARPQPLQRHVDDRTTSCKGDTQPRARRRFVPEIPRRRIGCAHAGRDRCRETVVDQATDSSHVIQPTACGLRKDGTR